jgi:N-acetylglucosamine-6-phosphate deacetylase
MTRQAFIGAALLAGGQWHQDHALLVSDGRVEAIVPEADIPASARVHALNGGALLPGFIDTQVNGGGGILFNDEPTIEGIAAIASAHRAFGTTALLPTLISDDLSVVDRAIAAVDSAIEAGVPGIIGIHVEGPFLNPDKHGIHDAGKFRTLDAEAIALLGSARHGRTLVTLAPECAPPGAIAALVARGVVVAAGHSLASYEDMARAAAEGLTGVTHLFNAMSQLGSRAPGLVGAAIDLGLVSGLIVDGHHVHPATLRAAFRAKGAAELMLVTDAMPSVSDLRPGFRLGETWISVENGVLRGPDGTLAGSNLDMARAVRNAVEMLDVDLPTASRMASATPAAFLSLSATHGDLLPGMRADMVHLDAELQPRGAWIGGEPG